MAHTYKPRAVRLNEGFSLKAALLFRFESSIMDYAQLKKLDDESARKMKEGTGPVDECICSLLSPQVEADKKSIGASIKKVFAAINPSKKKRNSESAGNARRGNVFRSGGNPFRGNSNRSGGNVIESSGANIPLVLSNGGIYSTKEVVKRKGSCGRCGCDKENIVLKHSYANIRITSPDVSSICPCPNDCFSDKTKLINNIKVTVERLTIDPDSENSETSLHNHRQQKIVREPQMTDKKSVTSLINAQYETDEDNLFDS